MTNMWTEIYSIRPVETRNIVFEDDEVVIRFFRPSFNAAYGLICTEMYV